MGNKIKRSVLMMAGILMIVMLFAAPLLAAETNSNPPGMAVFTDGNSSHVYMNGDSIAFRIGPFPCQAGKEDKLVLGIMEKSGGEFLTTDAPLEGLTRGTQGYYLQRAADDGGYFSVAGIISGIQQNGVLAVKIYDQDDRLLVNEHTGAEAFIPIVAADGTPAIVLGNTQAQVPAEPTLSGSLVRAMDDDLDHVYFDGQTIQLCYNLSGNISIPANAQDGISVVSGVLGEDRSFIINPSPLKNVTVQVQGNNKIIISGIIDNPGNNTLNAGVLGTSLQLPPMVPGASDLGTPMPAVSNDGKACIVGVAIPDSMLVSAEPALAELKNLYNTERPLTFAKEGLGSITFSPGLNIIEHRDELVKLDNCIKVSFNRETMSFEFEVMTEFLSFLEDKTAGLKAYGLAREFQLPSEFTQEQLDRFVRMGGFDGKNKPFTDEEIEKFINWDDVAYNQVEDTLLIPVKHFTTYTVTRQVKADPDESKYKAWPGGIVSKTANWEPTITFNRSIDSSSLGGITLWRRTASGGLQEIAISPKLQQDNSKVVLVKHSAPFSAGNYLLLISSGVTTPAGEPLGQPIKYEFKT